MHTPYCCPNCKTNRSRFNFIKQIPQAVKLDPHSGEIVAEYRDTELDPFHIPYRGPNYKIQCATCGLIEDERSFSQFALHQQMKP